MSEPAASASALPSFVYLGASDYALRILREILAAKTSRVRYLIDSGLDEARRRAIAAALGGQLDAAAIRDTSALRDPAFLAELRAAPPDFALSAHFSEILSEDFFTIPRHGVANLHSAYLPYNRGHWPEVWSIVRGTPAGITLHFIGAGLDTGDIIEQVEVDVLPEDTCATLARRVEVAGLQLVLRRWEDLMHGRAAAKPQSHRLPINLHKHVEALAEIQLDRTYTGKQLLDVLRALTIPHLLKGAFFVDPATGDRIRVQVSLAREPRGANPSVRWEHDS